MAKRSNRQLSRLNRQNKESVKQEEKPINNEKSK